MPAAVDSRAVTFGWVVIHGRTENCFLSTVRVKLLRPASLYAAPDAKAPVQDRVLESLILPLERSENGWLRVEYPESATQEWRFGWLAPADAREVRVSQERLCPDADAAHVLSMDATDGPACFGNRELTLAPVFLEARRAQAERRERRRTRVAGELR